MTNKKSVEESALGTIPSVLNAIAAVGEAMPTSFTIPAPKGPVTGAVQYFITRKEQVQGNLLSALPKGISEGLATKSAQGFALGVLSSMVVQEVKDYQSNQDAIKTAASNASKKGEITIRNPLSFYIPKTTREAVSTVLNEVVNQNLAYQTMEQAPIRAQEMAQAIQRATDGP